MSITVTVKEEFRDDYDSLALLRLYLVLLVSFTLRMGNIKFLVQRLIASKKVQTEGKH
ncbi:hypothetical protein [Lactococcus ileimucosae]|uniref:hypothetical protein n=1 Tax=Lactococcus ileimucosae TaxID=2941329 RepID=UPI0035136F56